MTRVCGDCGVEKSLDDFPRHKRRPLGRGYVCRRCAGVRTASWYKANRARPRRRLTQAELKEHARWGWIKRKYGLSRQDWLSMFAIQQGVCACCRSPNPGSKRGWHTDHDHRTGKVRGIICHSCNVMLGAARDSIAILECGKAYLRR